MRHAAWLLILLLMTGAAVPAQPPSAAEAKDGFVSLFNGQDFTGWRFGEKATPPANWKVEDGVIKLSGGGAPHLASQWDYEDFDIRLQWRGLKDGYNSGFYIRSGRGVGANQINLAQKAAGNLMGGAKGGKAVPELQKPVKEWNDWRVLAVGDKVSFWCNDQLAWEVTGFKDRRGYLGLQAEGAPMEFRNIRIKELGYRSLCDNILHWSPAEEWKLQPKDLTLSTTGKGPFETMQQELKDYGLRLEWKADKGVSAAIGLRGKKEPGAALRIGDLPDGSGGIGDKPTKKADYPPAEWNYLEVRVAANKATVWLNGTIVAENVELKTKADTGGIALMPDGKPMQFRNVRIKEVK